METLTDRQREFLSEIMWGDRATRPLMRDMEITPGELAQWREQAEFNRELEGIEASLAFIRSTDTRRGACEHVRRMRLAVFGDSKVLSPKCRQAGKAMCASADALEKGVLLSAQRRPVTMTARLINPIHPAFAAQAEKILARMEALQRGAMEMRKLRLAEAEQNKALPPPQTEGEK